jgi:hypothetical protein
VLEESTNAELYPDYLGYIESEKTRDAFRYVVGFAAGLKRFNARLQFNGEVRDFRFMDEHGEQPFSFITNQRWLLFYFRPPAIRSGRYSFQALKQVVDSAGENPAGEWTVKVRSLDDALRLVRLLDLE